MSIFIDRRYRTDRLVDIVVLAPDADVLQVLLVQRKNAPFRDWWALPGGQRDHDAKGIREDEAVAARRRLKKETGITVPKLVRIGSYSGPDRDPRGPSITTAFLAVLPRIVPAVAADDAKNVQWNSVAEQLRCFPLAFDHTDIIKDAVAAAKEWSA